MAKRKFKSAAVVTIHRAAEMTPRGRKAIAKWLRDRAHDLEQHGQDLAGVFRARYLYR